LKRAKYLTAESSPRFLRSRPAFILSLVTES